MLDKQTEALELFVDSIVDEKQEKYVPQMAKLKEQTLPELPDRKTVLARNYDNEDLFNIAADIVNKSLEYKVKEATREDLLRSEFEKRSSWLSRSIFPAGDIERYDIAIKELLKYDTKLDNELPLGEITSEYKGNKLVISSSGRSAKLEVCGVDFSLTDRQRNLSINGIKYNLTSKTAGELYNLIDNVRTDREQKKQQQETRINNIHLENEGIEKQNEITSRENDAIAAYKQKCMGAKENISETNAIVNIDIQNNALQNSKIRKFKERFIRKK
jgi:hypothetical protein